MCLEWGWLAIIDNDIISFRRGQGESGRRGGSRGIIETRTLLSILSSVLWNRHSAVQLYRCAVHLYRCTVYTLLEPRLARVTTSTWDNYQLEVNFCFACSRPSTSVTLQSWDENCEQFSIFVMIRVINTAASQQGVSPNKSQQTGTAKSNIQRK